jgi:protein-S-isoprenylcysteine O-methyltransferase Ste14
MAAGLYLVFGPPRLPDALDSIAQPIFAVNTPVAFAGLVLVLCGVAFTLWARFVLDGNWSGAATLKADHTLTRTGPYRITRHPIYTGILVALSGTALQRGSLASVLGVLLCAAALWLKLNIEEQLMIQRFGNDYLAYRARVPALFPFRL